jgi:hypothetical protein
MIMHCREIDRLPRLEGSIIGDMTCFAIDVAEVEVYWHVVGG